jgi:two-component system, NarL family, response regulator DegU
MKQVIPTISVVLADDHPLFRQGLEQTIKSDSRLKLVGQANNGSEALQLIQTLKPDIAVLDLNMPQLTGLDIAARVRDDELRTRIILLTMVQEEAAFSRAMNLGVSGYILKESAAIEIANGLIAVAAGLPFVSPALSTFMLKRRQRIESLAQRTPTLEDLTVAERRVLKRIAEKRSSKEIAIELEVSPRTVDTHRANIGAKLGLKGSNSLLQFAIENRDALAELD